MKSFSIAVLATLASIVAARPKTVSARAISKVVKGTPFGFAAAVTGGGDATPVHPKTIDDLKKYLTSHEPQVIVISGTFNFSGSEGTKSFQACDPYPCTPSNGGQSLLNTLNGCGTHPLHSVTLDLAAYEGINVASNKTLVGTGNDTILDGKGLRMTGVSNIIIQNILITNLNSNLVWGGDAISMSDTNNIWIDHVTTSRTGRQHYSMGLKANKAVTISNSFIDGRTEHSASCDGHTYWGLELLGADDSITFYKNYLHFTSGRSPALSGGTLFHAIDSVWESNTGHAIEGGTTKGGLFEGCTFRNVTTVLEAGYKGSLFSATAANAASCEALGRKCAPNSFSNSGAFTDSATGFLASLRGVSVPPPTSEHEKTVKTAGNTL